MLNENFVYLTLLLNFLAGLSYIVDIIKGKAIPNRVTWFLWGLAPLIAFAAQIKQGVGIISLFTLSVGLNPIIIFLLSFLNKKSKTIITKFDLICGGLSLLGLALWYLTQTGDLAILFSIFSDFLAGVPTFIKSYKHPETESAQAFIIATISSIITLLTITNWTFRDAGFSTYIFLANGTIMLLLITPRRKLKS